MKGWHIWLFAAIIFGAVTGIAYRSESFLPGGAGGKGAVGFSSISYGQLYKYNSLYPTKYVNTDTYMNTWADDDVIYTWSGDMTFGWQGGPGNLNIAFSSLNGFTTALTGTLVNFASHWGAANAAGSDGATYKVSGLISVHGTLIASAIRQSDSLPGWLSSQLIKSTNHGTAFAPLPPTDGQPYASPTFGSGNFVAPSFFQYGKDYVGQNVDRSDEFVYGISPATPIGPNPAIILGRVPIATMANAAITDATGWQFYQGGDGMLDGSWGAVGTALNIGAFDPPWFYEASPIYLPAYSCYLWITSKNSVVPNSHNWNVYRALHPWGPWTLVQVDAWDPPGNAASAFTYGLYFPAVIVKSLSTDGGRHLMVATTGNFLDSDPQTGQYTLLLVPITVNP